VSIAIRPKRLNSTTNSSSVASSTDPVHPAPQHSEAPERNSNEAPETRISRHTEAPDRGEGRASLLKNGFTHGRSRS
jgi:hypothetical protein